MNNNPPNPTPSVTEPLDALVEHFGACAAIGTLKDRLAYSLERCGLTIVRDQPPPNTGLGRMRELLEAALNEHDTHNGESRDLAHWSFQAHVEFAKQPTQQVNTDLTDVERVARAIYEAGPMYDWDRHDAPPGNWVPVPWDQLTRANRDIVVHMARAALAAMHQQPVHADEVEQGYWGPDADGDWIITALGSGLEFAVSDEEKARAICTALLVSNRSGVDDARGD